MIYHHRANVKSITVFLNEYKVEKKHDPRTKLAPGAPVKRSALILSSDPSVYKFSGHVLKDFLMKSPIISFMTLTMTLWGSGFKFLPGVSWLIPSSPSYLLYFSVANVLNGLFQLTSGAWMYFVHSPEIILRSVLKKTIGGNFYHLPLQQDTQAFLRNIFASSINCYIRYHIRAYRAVISDASYCYFKFRRQTCKTTDAKLSTSLSQSLCTIEVLLCSDKPLRFMKFCNQPVLAKKLTFE